MVQGGGPGVISVTLNALCVPVRHRLCLSVGANTWAPHRSLHPRAHIRRPRRIHRRRRPCRRSSRRRGDRPRHLRHGLLRGAHLRGPAAGGPRSGGDRGGGRGCAGGCRPHARRFRRRDEAAASRLTRCSAPSATDSLRRVGLIRRRRRRRVAASPSADAATRRSAEESRGRKEDGDGQTGLRGSCGRPRRCRCRRLLEVRRASGSGSDGRPHCTTARRASAGQQIRTSAWSI